MVYAESNLVVNYDPTTMLSDRQFADGNVIRLQGDRAGQHLVTGLFTLLATSCGHHMSRLSNQHVTRQPLSSCVCLSCARFCDEGLPPTHVFFSESAAQLTIPNAACNAVLASQFRGRVPAHKLPRWTGSGAWRLWAAWGCPPRFTLWRDLHCGAPLRSTARSPCVASRTTCQPTSVAVHGASRLCGLPCARGPRTCWPTRGRYTV